jgi:hypothetical protein
MLLEIGSEKLNILKLSNRMDEECIERVFDRHYFPSLNTDSLRSLTLEDTSVFGLSSLLKQSFVLKELKYLTIRFRDDQCQEKLCEIYYHLLEVFPCHFPSLQSLDVSSDSEICHGYPNIARRFSSVLPDVSSLSLRHLCIDNMMIRGIYKLVARCPNLHSLTANVRLNPYFTKYQALPHLSSCQLVLIESGFSSLVTFLKQCNNLKRLTVSLLPVDEDGRMSDRWKDLIEMHLPNLKHFDLSMLSYYVSKDELEGSFLCNFSLDRFWIERRTKVIVHDGEMTEDEDSPTTIMISFSIQNPPVV